MNANIRTENDANEADVADEDSSIFQASSRRDYLAALDTFDTALCELCAVGQAASGRVVPPHHGMATWVLTGLTNSAISLIRAAPLSRWCRSDFQHWVFSTVAAHARAIIEGHILFSYLIETPESDEAWSVKINVMHLYDCTRRIKMFKNMALDEEVAGFKEQADELKERLENNVYFKSLPGKTQEYCLGGDSPMIVDRAVMLEKLGWDRKAFRVVYDLLSQHAHILPMAFYRIESNGRGTGVENEFDRSRIRAMLEMCAEFLRDCTEKMIIAFPDTTDRCQGKKSKFTHGPIGNRPR